MTDYLFHVHSFRCRHADMVPDEAYVMAAMDRGMKSIWFSDHAPFPGNPFGNRMAYDDLSEYLSTLSALKEKYEEQIDVHIGLEIEYLPSFKTYYEDLKAMPELEFLLLGQHFCEMHAGFDSITCLEPCPPWSFQYSQQDFYPREYYFCGQAETEGIRTGLFDYVAHPDRIYRHRKEWNSDMESTAKEIIAAAVDAGIPLEKNLASMGHKNYYWQEFWELVPDDHPTLYGVDAHLLSQIDRRLGRIK